ncbi:MAG: helix-turn-helix domain-containing protein [Actinoplanes sp.]
MEGFLTTDQLAARLGIQRASIYRMRTRGDLPEPEKVGRTPLWPVTVIETWEQSRPGHGWRKGQKRPPATE